MPDRPTPLSALDWIAASLALLLDVALVLFALVHAPSFRGMFADFGGELPLLTRLVLTPWPALVICAAATALVLTGVALTRSAMGLRRGLIVLGFLVALIGLGVCVVGVYLPIVEVAGAVR